MKYIIIVLIITNIILGNYQVVKIGKIDERLKTRINKVMLKKIIKEIEYNFERRLGVNIFDYSDKKGKPINLIWIKKTELEKKIKRYEKYKSSNMKRINEIVEFINKSNQYIKIKQEEIKVNYNIINYNIRNINKTRKNRNKLIRKINNMKRINNKMENKLNRFYKKFNKGVKEYNELASENNEINRYIEKLSKYTMKVAGRTIGTKRVETKIINYQGRNIIKKYVTKEMRKIDIYDFKNLKELKATIAHEICHLIGLNHTNAKYALMNPVIQHNQIDNLELKNADINLFRSDY